MAYVRTVKTASGARAVQIVHSNRRGARSIEHLGSAHDDVELAALKVAARQRLAQGQGVLDLGLDAVAAAMAGAAPLPITSSRMGHLWDALSRAYDVLGFDEAAGGDEVFRQLVLARIIEPTSKQDSLRVLDEVGVPAASYPTVNRRLPVYALDTWRKRLAWSGWSGDSIRMTGSRSPSTMFSPTPSSRTLPDSSMSSTMNAPLVPGCSGVVRTEKVRSPGLPQPRR